MKTTFRRLAARGIVPGVTLPILGAAMMLAQPAAARGDEVKGTCCVGTACTMTSKELCAGTFNPDIQTCGTPGNPTTCCKANFNGMDGVTVQDIFDFLNGWFAGDPRADINGFGGVSPLDIFTFFDAWFDGCQAV